MTKRLNLIWTKPGIYATLCKHTPTLSTCPVTLGPPKCLHIFLKESGLKDLWLIKSIAISVSRPYLNPTFQWVMNKSVFITRISPFLKAQCYNWMWSGTCLHLYVAFRGLCSAARALLRGSSRTRAFSRSMIKHHSIIVVFLRQMKRTHLYLQG